MEAGFLHTLVFPFFIGGPSSVVTRFCHHCPTLPVSLHAN